MDKQVIMKRLNHIYDLVDNKQPKGTTLKEIVCLQDYVVNAHQGRE